MSKLALAVIALSACGRVGFDSASTDGGDDGDDGGAIDAAPGTCPPATPICVDPSFGAGGNGLQVFDFGASGSATFGYQGIAIQPDGKIVIAGKSGSAGSTVALVMRFNPDGTTDSSFGSGGAFQLTPVSNSLANSVAVVPDGSIVAVGTAGGTGLMFWLEPTGSLRTSFGIGGFTATNLGATDSVTFNGVAFDNPSNDIIVGGEGNYAGTGFDLLYGRFDATGAARSAFTTRHSSRANDDSGALLGIGPSGAIDLVGRTSNGSNFQGLLEHVSATTGMETEWESLVDSSGGPELRFFAGTYLPDGTLVTVGDYGPQGGPYDISIQKYGPYDGAFGFPPVVDFGTAGLTQVDYGHDDSTHSIVRLPDGRFLVGVRATDGTGVNHSKLQLFSAMGAPLTSLDLSSMLNSLSNGVNWLALDAQGRVIVLGDIDNHDNHIGLDLYVGRLIIP